MEDLGFSIPLTKIGSQQTVLGTISLLVGAVEKFGAKVTVEELIAAGTLSE